MVFILAMIDPYTWQNSLVQKLTWSKEIIDNWQLMSGITTRSTPTCWTPCGWSPSPSSAWDTGTSCPTPTAAGGSPWPPAWWWASPRDYNESIGTKNCLLCLIKSAKLDIRASFLSCTILRKFHWKFSKRYEYLKQALMGTDKFDSSSLATYLCLN